jgi:sensor c-di-GMP phosphodiesterase-like protein
MMLIPRRRLWVAVVATLVAAIAGGECGFLLGRMQVEKTAYTRMKLAARRSGDPFVALLNESSAMLDRLNQSRLPHCSSQEKSAFRKLLFQSEYLRDAGRFRDNRVACSTLFGEEEFSAEPAAPAITMQDGLRLYRDVTPFRSPKWVVFLLRKGDSFVVEDLSGKLNWVEPTMDYESTIPDQASGQRVRPGGRPVIFPDAVLDRPFQGRVGDRLSVTLCWPREGFCTSVFQSHQALMAANRGLLGWSAAVGTGCGVMLALIFLLFYSHSRNMSQQLRRAIRRGDVQVVYQPIVEMHSGRIVEAEALARWTDEDGFAVSPEIFVRLALDWGFIHELTELVVQRVLNDFGQILPSIPEFRLNINVTAADLTEKNLLALLDREMKKHQVDASSLVIEVTEGSTAHHQETVEAIRALRRRGHSVQVDDFGTGYSSLAYLKDLAVDGLKIDKTFTLSVGTDAVTATILPQMLAMAESLHLSVIVEGIETQEQADYFVGKHPGVLGQGWHYGRPGAPDVILAALERQQLVSGVHPHPGKA